MTIRFMWLAALAVVTITLAGRIEAQTAGPTIACDEQEVRYSPFDPSDGEINIAETKNLPNQLAAKTKKHSPQGTRYLLVNDADFSRPGPWTTTVFIGGVGLNGRLLKLAFVDHANYGVQVQWLNEKLLFIQVWWNRVISTDLILDINSRTFLYKETAVYGDLTQPCH